MCVCGRFFFLTKIWGIFSFLFFFSKIYHFAKKVKYICISWFFAFLKMGQGGEGEGSAITSDYIVGEGMGVGEDIEIRRGSRMGELRVS